MLKFLQMTQTGYGVSRQYTEGILKYCVESGGKNNLLPDSFDACKNVAEGLIAKLQGDRKTYVIDIPTPLEVRQLVSLNARLALPSVCCRSSEFTLT